MMLHTALRTDVGLVRGNNEDAALASPGLIVVSDGVGGRPAGEVASALAVSVVRAMTAEGVELTAAVQGASDVVHALSLTNPLFTGMCCTLTAAVATETGVRLAHVGDSLAWVVLDGHVTRLTADQTIAAQLVREGRLTPADVATHPKRATLSQAVGNGRPLEIDVSEHELTSGDRLVLATDGLHYAGDEVHLETLLAKPVSADELCDLLVDAAMAGGGNDNVTVVVADLTAGDPA